MKVETVEIAIANFLTETTKTTPNGLRANCAPTSLINKNKITPSDKKALSALQYNNSRRLNYKQSTACAANYQCFKSRFAGRQVLIFSPFACCATELLSLATCSELFRSATRVCVYASAKLLPRI